MNYLKILISFSLLILGQLGVWLQVYGSSKWTDFGINGKYFFINLLFSIPIAYVFMLSAKIGFEGSFELGYIYAEEKTDQYITDTFTSINNELAVY